MKPVSKGCPPPSGKRTGREALSIKKVVVPWEKRKAYLCHGAWSGRSLSCLAFQSSQCKWLSIPCQSPIGIWLQVAMVDIWVTRKKKRVKMIPSPNNSNVDDSRYTASHDTLHHPTLSMTHFQLADIQKKHLIEYLLYSMHLLPNDPTSSSRQVPIRLLCICKNIVIGK